MRTSSRQTWGLIAFLALASLIVVVAGLLIPMFRYGSGPGNLGILVVVLLVLAAMIAGGLGSWFRTREKQKRKPGEE